MTRSQTIAAVVITITVAFVIALFFLSGGPEEVESLVDDGPEQATGAAASNQNGEGADETAADETPADGTSD